MINQEVLPKNCYWQQKKREQKKKKSEHLRKMQKLAGDKAEHAGDTKNKSKNCKKVKLSCHRIFAEVWLELCRNLPEKVEQVGHPKNRNNKLKR
jgi:hypothetical protein